MTKRRSTHEVLADHLRLRRPGHTDEDLRRNYDDDVVMLSHLGQVRGIGARKMLAELLACGVRDDRIVAQTIAYSLSSHADRLGDGRWHLTTERWSGLR